MGHENLVGTVLEGRYRIDRVVGSGGMSVVYAASDLETQAEVAIKLLRHRHLDSSRIVKRFHQEAVLLNVLQHKNICSATEHGCMEDGTPYLVMPLLDGCPFSKLLSAEEPPSIQRVVDIALQVLEALDFAHEKKVIHRDLKPDNIFIAKEDDSSETVQLLDFGISKVLEKDEATTLTSTGMVLGTVYYLAPEQARGERNIDRRVDIYAMGVILYQALTGKLPFEGETYNEVVYKITGTTYKPPSSLNPKIPRCLEKVILKAMSYDPLRRYANARLMGEALERALENPTSDLHEAPDSLAATQATSSGINFAYNKPRGKRPVSIAVALGIVVVSLVSLAFFNLNPKAESQRSAHDSTVDQRNSAKEAVWENKSAPMPKTTETNGDPLPPMRTRSEKSEDGPAPLSQNGPTAEMPNLPGVAAGTNSKHDDSSGIAKPPKSVPKTENPKRVCRMENRGGICRYEGNRK